MVPSFIAICSIASVELNEKHKIKNETQKELDGKHKKKRGNTQYETPKSLKPQDVVCADAWLPFSPGRCYEPRLKVPVPGRPTTATWSPFCPGS